MLLSQSFAVPARPGSSASVVPGEHPFFEAGASTSVSSQLTATQPPLGVPGTSAVRDENGSATRPVQGPGTSDVATQALQAPSAELATQPLQAPGAGTATQPTQAPGTGPEVLSTGNESTQLNQSLPGIQPDEFTGESDSEAEVAGEPASPASIHVQGELPEDSADQDLSEDANYRETVEGSGLCWASDP